VCVLICILTTVTYLLLLVLAHHCTDAWCEAHEILIEHGSAPMANCAVKKLLTRLHRAVSLRQHGFLSFVISVLLWKLVSHGRAITNSLGYWSKSQMLKMSLNNVSYCDIWLPQNHLALNLTNRREQKLATFIGMYLTFQC